MKKILSMVLVVMMVLSMIPAAYATNITIDGNQTANTVVTYGLDEGYTVVIPDSVALNADGVGTATLSASNVIIASGKTLNVRISGADYTTAWELIDQADPDNAVAYSIKKSGAEIKNNDVVLSSASGANWNSSVSSVLDFAITGEIAKSGSYKDTLTFTVSID